jgi:hypothetical protein
MKEKTLYKNLVVVTTTNTDKNRNNNCNLMKQLHNERRWWNINSSNMIAQKKATSTQW